LAERKGRGRSYGAVGERGRGGDQGSFGSEGGMGWGAREEGWKGRRERRNAGEKEGRRALQRRASAGGKGSDRTRARGGGDGRKKLAKDEKKKGIMASSSGTCETQ